jgi:GNAT superfamily N-acetyltransferase
VVGIALLYTKYSTWKGRCIFLEDIIVTEKHRNKGIGKALFQRAIRYAAEQNAGRLEWQVLDWNESAIGFYKKFGALLDPTWINCKFTREQLKQLNAGF